jgi:hypothetical protein
MARQSAILIPASVAATKIAALTSAQTVVLGINTIFVINADQDINIEFYNSKGGALVASVASYRIPSGQQTTFDMGNANDTISLFAASSANVYIKQLSVV